MKVFASIFALPALLVAALDSTVVALVVFGLFAVGAVFCYLLISRREVAPDLEAGKFRLRFRRLPARSEAGTAKRTGSDDDQADQA